MLTTTEVTNWLKLTSSDENLVLVVAAINAYVDSLSTIDRTELGAWSETTRLGAVMLASRVYRRRNSVNGIESFTEGGTSYVSRYDSDIARLLHMDLYSKPKVG